MQHEKIKNPKTNSYELRSFVVNIFLFIMFTFFPLFLTKQYAHARNDKFVLFIILSGLLVIFELIYSLINKFDDSKKRDLNTPRNLTKLSVPDIAMLSFLFFAIISTIISEYKLDSLTGNMGRNNGLILIFLYVCVYFVITRFLNLRNYVFIGYLVFSSFVSLLTTLNYFYIDPLGLLEGYDKATINDFGSTIGNKNTIASFICLFLPIALMMFVVCKEKYMKILSGISIIFAFTGLLCADSSSGFLGLIIAIPVMAIISSRKYDHLLFYFLGLTIMFASSKLLRLFSFILNDKSKDFEDFSKFFIYDNKSYFLIIIPLVIFLLMLLLRNKVKDHYPKKAVIIILSTLFTISVLAAVFFFIYYTFIDTNSELGSLRKFFRFNEKWGTHRGFFWINGMKEFNNLDFFHKLFGTGPDTFYYLFSNHFEELKRFGDSSTNCIHNEYLNYLTTQGILGLLAYLTLLISVIVRAAKKIKNCPFIAVPVSAVICYCAQSFVNLYQPITTPVFMIFIAITEALSRESFISNNDKIKTI